MIVELGDWKIDDAIQLASCANNEKIANNLTDQFPHPYGTKEAISFIEMISKKNPRTVRAIVVDGVKCGSIGVHPQKDIFKMNAELGYWLAENYWGKGIATKAIELMVAYAFSKFEFTRIFARPFGNNIASQRVLEKAGFVLEAKFEKTLIKNSIVEDEHVYAIRK